MGKHNKNGREKETKEILLTTAKISLLSNLIGLIIKLIELFSK